MLFFTQYIFKLIFSLQLLIFLWNEAFTETFRED